MQLTEVLSPYCHLKKNQDDYRDSPGIKALALCMTHTGSILGTPCGPLTTPGVTSKHRVKIKSSAQQTSIQKLKKKSEKKNKKFDSHCF